MKDEIMNVLSDESYTTNEERVDAITSCLGPLVIPKDKFNDVNKQLKDITNKYNTLNSDFEDFKKSKMTDEEKEKADKEAFELAKKENNIKSSKLAVKELFFDNGIKITDKDTKYQKLLNSIISEDKDKSLELATQFLDILKETKEDTSKQTTIDLLNNTPKPVVGNPNNKISQIDTLNEQLKTAVERHDQVQIAYITRLIQEETNKKTI